MMAPRKLNDADLDKIITGIAFPGYGELVELREIVDDCIAELRTVEEKSKYLPPTAERWSPSTETPVSLKQERVSLCHECEIYLSLFQFEFSRACRRSLLEAAVGAQHIPRHV